MWYYRWVFCVALATSIVGLAALGVTWIFSPSSLAVQELSVLFRRAAPEYRSAPTNAPYWHHEGHLNYLSAYRHAVRQKKCLLIYFASINSTWNRDLEINMLSKPRVQEALRRHVVVALHVDHVPDSKVTPVQAESLAETHSRWQETMTKQVSGLALVLFQPDLTIPFDSDGNPKGVVLGVKAGQLHLGDVLNLLALLEQR